MNRKWLTGLTLAGVAGTGGAAFAAVGEPATKPAPAPASVAPVAQAAVQLPVVTEASTVTTASAVTAAETTAAPLPAIRTVTYQIGDAASLTLEIDGTQMTVREVEPSDGWSVAAISNTGAHIDVQFTDGTQIVGLVIDLVGSDPVVSVTNTLAPGASGPLSADPVTVSSSDEDSAPSNPPLAAIPPTIPETTPTTTAIVPMAPVTEPAPAPAAPSPAATTTTSAVVADESDDDGEHEEQSTEHEDHEDDGGEIDD